ncbi:Peroxisomal membrane signal receptor PTS1 [Puccinia graminis f. sp. tritici]|uniref:Peroxisomal membrane signal receptor PTS1 n=1 Tax=Puccinia graminis f. sp. tritici TaxID=56615 RepID=A0A5B0LYI6_PUCGR|nr:Peroxisomal membrane signal receptor PTS1 [Puccinia graminis f. sp. tritici]
MTPPPKIVLVVKNEGGKEIGGGNHYCTICRAPAPPTAPAIIKAGNAEKRRSKQLANRPIAPLPSTSITASETMSDTVPPSGGQEQPTADSTRDSARTADGSDMSTAKEWFKAVLKIQHSSIVQAQEDRRQALEDRRADRQMFLAVHQASADRIGPTGGSASGQ